MDVENFSINLTSEEPDRLIGFYRDVVGLPQHDGMGPGAFKAGAATLFVDGHSDTKGGAKEPHRVLINFKVNAVAAEQKRLEAAGAKFIRKEGKQEWGGVISTFTDPDGNYLQILEWKQ